MRGMESNPRPIGRAGLLPVVSLASLKLSLCLSLGQGGCLTKPSHVSAHLFCKQVKKSSQNPLILSLGQHGCKENRKLFPSLCSLGRF
jgi:hypothetical protein